jgi:hypothetical protein
MNDQTLALQTVFPSLNTTCTLQTFVIADIGCGDMQFAKFFIEKMQQSDPSGTQQSLF